MDESQSHSESTSLENKFVLQPARIPPEILRRLSQTSNLMSIRSIAFDWILILSALFSVLCFESGWIKAIAFCLISRQQLALAILMHDGAHRRLFKSFQMNDFFCQFFCAGPLIFSMYSYQKLHLKHHKEPLASDDPDLSLIGGYPITKMSFLRKLARDALGISYFKFIRYFIHMARKSKNNIKSEGKIPLNDLSQPNLSEPAVLTNQSSGKKLSFPVIGSSVIVTNFILFIFCYLNGRPAYYFLFWLLPAFTLLQVLLRIRGVAEHAGYKINSDQRLNARTVINPMQTFLFAPHCVNYHIEHHVFPSVPCFNLPELHRIMKEQNMLPNKNVYPGYGSIVKELTY